MNLLDRTDLGWKGAALAALGEIVAGFLALVTSLADSSEGVKLGESTFSAFFRLLLLFHPLAFAASPHHMHSRLTFPCFDSHLLS
jgi:hypothetical protein